VLALERGQLEVLDFIVAIDGGCGEIGGGFAYEYGHVMLLAGWVGLTLQG
jgi:hypothetical protein